MALTKDEIRNLSKTDLLQKMSDPATRAELESVWNAPESVAVEEPPASTTEEQAAIDASVAVVNAFEAERVAAEAVRAEQARKDAEEAARKAAEKNRRIVVDYQVTDPESGKPIGNRTHFEADTWEEMSEKQKIAHELATRAYERVKNRKITTKPEEPPKSKLTDEQLEAALADIRKSEDPKQAVAALRRVTGAEDAEAERRALKEEKAALAAQAISFEFMRQHLHDYNPCDANGKEIGKYITDNNLEWTRDNLEEAFDQVRDKLAPPVAPAVSTPAPALVNAPVATPPQAAAIAEQAPVIETPPAPTVIAPATPEPPIVAAEPTPAPAAPNPPVVRRVPNSGIVPGTTVGRPTGPAPVGLTKQDIAKMPNTELRRRMRDPKLRAEIERVANSR